MLIMRKVKCNYPLPTRSCRVLTVCSIGRCKFPIPAYLRGCWAGGSGSHLHLLSHLPYRKRCRHSWPQPRRWRRRRRLTITRKWNGLLWVLQNALSWQCKLHLTAACVPCDSIDTHLHREWWFTVRCIDWSHAQAPAMRATRSVVYWMHFNPVRQWVAS